MVLDLNPAGWNWGQFKAAGRHVASYVAGGVTAAVAFHFLTPGQGTDITENIVLISDGFTKIATGLAGISAVLLPVYTAWKAAHSASSAVQGRALTATANNTANPEQAKAAQVAIASAVIDTKELDIGKGQILAPPEVAAAVPSEKVMPK